MRSNITNQFTRILHIFILHITPCFTHSAKEKARNEATLHSPANYLVHEPHCLVKYVNIVNQHIFVNMAPTQRNKHLYSYQADVETLLIALESLIDHRAVTV